MRQQLPPEIGAQGFARRMDRIRVHDQHLISDKGLGGQQHGFRDWNTLRARAESNAPVDRLRVGDLIAGTYLGQAFTGRILGLSAYGDDGHYHIRMHFDEAVDVVTFDSFSSFRQRVRGVVDRFGRSPRKTSNGQPHIELKL